MLPKKDLIILVDDQRSYRALFEAKFKALGFEVRSFENGKSALAALELMSEKDRERAIFVSDRQMPEMDGTELIGKVRRKYPEIPIMMWTADTTVSIEGLRNQLKDYSVYAKTMDTSEIESDVRTTLKDFDARTNPKASQVSHSRARRHTQDKGWDIT